MMFLARPKDDEQRKIGSKGRAVVHFQLDAEHWDYKEETGNDCGRDCVIELSEGDEWRNHKVEGQIKATTVPKLVNCEISYPMPVKTIEYALGTSTAFILFVVDTKNQEVYYQCIQQLFIENKALFSKLNQQTINIHIPTSQRLSNSDDMLKQWACTVYVDGPREALKIYKSEANTVSECCE